MKIINLLLIGLTSFFMCLPSFGTEQIKYTSLKVRDCKPVTDPAMKTLYQDEPYAGVCNGFGDYTLVVIDTGERSAINIHYKNKIFKTLDFMNSSIGVGYFPVINGDKAEWHFDSLTPNTPTGLIYRISSQNPVDIYKPNLSHLVVIKLPDAASIEPHFCGLSKTNENARKLLKAC